MPGLDPGIHEQRAAERPPFLSFYARSANTTCTRRKGRSLMGSQDTLRYIRQVTGRAMGHPSLSKTEIDRLDDAWKGSLKDQPVAAELVPARIVTVLEVFFRDWVEQLVDHGPPYLERAATLRLDLKFDFALASNLRGGTITLGQLVAHS